MFYVEIAELHGEKIEKGYNPLTLLDSLMNLFFK